MPPILKKNKKNWLNSETTNLILVKNDIQLEIENNFGMF